jgi:hypothetical protein
MDWWAKQNNATKTGLIIFGIFVVIVGYVLIHNANAKDGSSPIAVPSGTCALTGAGLGAVAVGMRDGHDAAEIIAAVGAAVVPFVCQPVINDLVNDPAKKVDLKVNGQYQSLSGNQVQQLPSAKAKLTDAELQHSLDCIDTYGGDFTSMQECFNYQIIPNVSFSPYSS